MLNSKNQSDDKVRKELKVLENEYRTAIKAGVHQCRDSISTKSFKEYVKQLAHKMGVLRRRLGLTSNGTEWLEQIVYGETP